MYRIFDTVLSSSVALAGLPEVRQEETSIQIEQGSSSINYADYDWIHSWEGADGEALLTCGRLKGVGNYSSFLLRFPGVAEFTIEESVIACYPCSDCTEESLRHLLLDQVVPRVWANMGHLVLHASAVQLPGGQVLAFAGESGWGKSTLAGALEKRGCRLLGDDCLHLSACGNRARLATSYPGLRLEQDSIEALQVSQLDWSAISDDSSKRRLARDFGDGRWVQREPLWLDTLYFLTSPGCGEAMISTAPISGPALVNSMIRRSFLLDVHDARCAVRQMKEACAVSVAIPRACGLAYPRDYHRLPELCDWLLAQASA